jgi:major vault protein
MESSTIRILPHEYIHILDKNKTVTRIEIGPMTYVRLDHEKIESGPTPKKMIILSPQTYCKVNNPVIRDNEGKIVQDKFGQSKLKYGESEYRFYEKFQDPFPLYPGEELAEPPTDLKIIQENKALRVKATRDFNDGSKEIGAGDEWLVEGPQIYYPRVEVAILKEESAPIVGIGQALRLRASQDLTDKNGVERRSGEEWLIRAPGPYMPGVYEELKQIQTAIVLTDTQAIQVSALQNFTDVYKQTRKAGEAWLITNKMASTHILDVYEKMEKEVSVIILRKNQYCVILDPFDAKEGKNKLGTKIIRKGEDAFFLHPGEQLKEGIKEVEVLGEKDALLVKAKENYTQKRINNPELNRRVKEILDKKAEETELKLIKNRRNGHIRPVPTKDIKEMKDYEEEYKLKEGEKIHDFISDVKRTPGEQWMEYGPLNYLPPVEVEIVRRVEEIPLDSNEGIYVRDIRTGAIKAIIGQTYMLQPHEQLYEIEIPKAVEELLPKNSHGILDKTRVISYRCPFNSAIQIYDYKKKKSRIVFGPELVLLQPDEIFTVNVLSGGKPKVPGAIKCLEIKLGPDFTSDLIEVETSDHARLLLKLSYNWHFKVDKNDSEGSQRIFSIKDFIGDMCTIMAAKIRATVAGVNFENFHKSFAKLIRTSIFGLDKDGKVRDEYIIEKNGLIITNVDIQQVEPVDDKTKKSLKETVSLAIEITTKTQEENAKRESERIKQEAEGELERRKIEYDSKAEEARKKLLELQSEAKSIQNSGKANAEAKALAEASLITSKAKVGLSKLNSEALKIETESKLKRDRETNRVEVDKEKRMSDLRITKMKAIAEIEAKKFEETITSLGQETLIAIANSGMESQVKLLEGLGLKGYLLTDGKTPVNLFNAANNLIGGNSENKADSGAQTPQGY